MIAVLEPNPTGHRLRYVRHLVDEARRRGEPVLVLTSRRATAGREFEVHLGDVPWDASCVLRVLPAAAAGGRAPALLRAFAALPRDAHVVVPDGDRRLPLAILAATVLRRRVTLLLMRPRGPASGPARIAKRALVAAAARTPGVRIARLTGPFGDAAPPPRPLRSLPAVHDPAPETPDLPRAAALRALGVPAGDGPLMLLSGAIDARKSPRAILDWLSSPASGAARLLVAGSLAPDVAELLAGDRGRALAAAARLHVLPGYLPERTLQECFAACDGVFVLHENEGSSGALVQAAAAGRFAVAWGSREVTGTVRAHGLGAVAADRSPAALAAAVAEAVAGQRLRLGRPEVAGPATFYAQLTGSPAPVTVTAV